MPNRLEIRPQDLAKSPGARPLGKFFARSKILSLLFSLAAASVLPLPAVAQQEPISGQQNGGQAYNNSSNSNASSGGISNNGTAINDSPGNLTAQQKYQRDVLIFKRLKETDELMKGKHYVQARQILEELAALDPNPYSKDVHGLLAEACYKLGNNQEAAKNYELVIKFDPKDDPQPYWNIALSYINMNNFDQATKWCKKLLSKDPPPELKRQAERFLSDVGKERAEQQNGDEDSPDYLGHLQASHEANRWPREKIPIKVFIEDDRFVPGFHSQYVVIFLNCLEIWTRATQQKLAFQIVDNLASSDLNLIFTANADDIARQPGMAPAEQGLATVRAFTTGQGYGHIDHAKVQILVHKPSSDKELSEDEMKEVCLHEIGHALGLSGHSLNDADVMHFMMSFRQLPALTKRDKQTIARLYWDYPSLSQTASASYQPQTMAANPQYQQQAANQGYPPEQFQQQRPFQQQQFPQQQQFQQQPQYQPQQAFQQPQDSSSGESLQFGHQQGFPQQQNYGRQFPTGYGQQQFPQQPGFQPLPAPQPGGFQPLQGSSQGFQQQYNQQQMYGQRLPRQQLDQQQYQQQFQQQPQYQQNFPNQ